MEPIFICKNCAKQNGLDEGNTWIMALCKRCFNTEWGYKVDPELIKPLTKREKALAEERRTSIYKYGE